MEHRMTLTELIRSTAAVGEYYRRQARAAVQSGRLDRDKADRIDHGDERDQRLEEEGQRVAEWPAQHRSRSGAA